MDATPEAVRYTVRTHQEGGSLWAEVAELPGCFASGSDERELQEALVEAIGLYLSTDGTTVQVELTSTEPVEQVEEQKYLVCH